MAAADVVSGGLRMKICPPRPLLHQYKESIAANNACNNTITQQRTGKNNNEGETLAGAPSVPGRAFLSPLSHPEVSSRIITSVRSGRISVFSPALTFIPSHIKIVSLLLSSSPLSHCGSRR